MKKLLDKYPSIVVILLALTFIRFQYNGDNWTLNVPGIPTGVLVVYIVVIYFLCRTLRILQRMANSRGFPKQPFPFKYDMIFPVGIIILALKGSWQGPIVRTHYGELNGVLNQQPQWLLQFGGEYALAGVGILFAFVIMNRIYGLAKALADTAHEVSAGQPQQPPAG